MLTEREVHTDVRDLLINNRPFQFAHLIKFERPSRPDAAGVVSTSAHRYTYLTDASRDVTFNDGSKDHNGFFNGPQNYIANKVLNVSNVQEATEAKASNFTITLDGNGIGAAVSSSGVVIAAIGTPADAAAGTYWSVTWPATIDILSQGFREGDKVELVGLASGHYEIFKFAAGNSIVIKKLVDNITTGTGTVTMSLISEEIKSILMNKSAGDYASFINREVFIYRAYFENGQMVGTDPDANGIRGPILLFKGIISNVSFDDDDNGIKVQWGLTSHWGDFAQVRGRITSDDFHRALDQNGRPQPASAIKPIYAYDKGFAHSETSINLLAQYSVQVEKQDVKAKSGFLGLGIGAKVKVKKYFVNEQRQTNLDFQLAAKSIPVMYGVRSLTGIPVFADTELNDSSTVYVIYALCEGEIGAIYDVYVDGKSLICNNESDYDLRHAQTAEETVDVICRGRADRGDILSGTGSVNTSPAAAIDYYDTIDREKAFSRSFNPSTQITYQPYIPPTAANAFSDSAGVTAGQSISLTSPITFTLDFFNGSEGQKAASQLVTLAKANGLKVQNDYWTGSDTAEYWGPNHRLADTAYLLAKFKIKEGETSLPDLEFILKTKVLDCYNYDYSYTHDDKASGENPNNFTLGQMVALHRSDTNAVINASVQIIDKWSFYRPDGVKETRFRFSTPPSLGYNDGIPTITNFYMLAGANRWTMTTFNHVLHSGTVGAEQSFAATEVTTGPRVHIVAPTPVGGEPAQGTPIYSIRNPTNSANEGAIVIGDYVSGAIQTRFNSKEWIER